METDKLRELAELMEEKGLSVLEIKEDENGRYVRMERGGAKVEPPAAPVSEKAESAKGAFSGKSVKSPMVGVFYASPSPEEKPYVAVGDFVKKGDVLCIIEAMKLMNEIVADEDGEIAKICVSDGQVVEYGQCLFIIK